MERETDRSQISQDSGLPDLCQDSPPSYSEAIVTDQSSIGSAQDEVSERDSVAPLCISRPRTVRYADAFPPLNRTGQLVRSASVVLNPPGLLALRSREWKPSPVLVECPYCQRRVLTQTQNFVERYTVFIAQAINFLLGCVAWRFKYFPDVAHYCPFCKSHLGTYLYNASKRPR